MESRGGVGGGGEGVESVEVREMRKQAWIQYYEGPTVRCDEHD